jgi:hypothetical protein
MPACSLSSLYKGDSTFNHVPLQSLSIARLAGMHQKTITLHSHCKTGVVAWSSGMWGNGILMPPKNSKISVSHESVVLDIALFQMPHFSCSSMILNLFPIMTGIVHKWQVINTPAVHPTKSRGNASKKIDYLPFLLPPLFWNTWDCIRCKTAKRGGVMISQRTWGTGTFSTGFYEALHPLLNFEFSFDLANHTARLTNLL